ncbi:splicing factor ESS-2 homolog [Telopea speciosissima]|uniref:splicing factor ESS-2 homolog n=1 Tax=Telopea speciosissima TaxID=54955 RepID=UPI001CC7C2C7|nr:splicing factor ESS-2 homolog [Telopea speciosissima]
MLLSPGHSPRHISFSPSPAPSEGIRENPCDSSSINPPRNPNKRPKVLDEDTYVAAIEKIIERDFFPDISKLRDRIDWLEAVRSGDPVLIRDAQLKILERRRGKASNSHAEGNKTRTPGSNLRTPGSIFSLNSTPFDLDKIPIQADAEGEEFVDDSVDVSLTLDEFFRRYTSEDNNSFSKIVDKVNRKRKERFGYLIEGEKEQIKTIESGKKDQITDGYGSSGQPLSTLDGWKYTAKNLLMYNPADRGEVPLTEAEKEVRLKALTKEINRTNTRFHGKMMDSRPKEEEDTVAVVYAPVAGGTPVPMWDREAERSKKYDLEDLRKTPNPFYVESNKISDNGYNYVRTPSPAPGVDESPFITWGEIEGTPLRLEAEDTPVGIGGSSDGPHFRIPFPPSRDVKAHTLSREAARKLRERSKMFQKPPLPSPVTVRGGSASPSVRTLSPAAQKFVRNAIANAKSSSSVDESLRASYRGGSPAVGTPKAGRSLTRFGRDGSLDSRSPSVREASNPPW